MTSQYKAIDQNLQRSGFDTKERLTIYGSMLTGILTPIVFTRYTGFGDSEGSIAKELTYWGGSVVASIPLSFFGWLGGMAVGGGLAAASRHMRMQRDLEERVE